MNSTSKIIAVAIIAIVVVAGAFVALNGNNGGNDEKEKIAISGSTTVSPYMLEVKGVYEKNHNVVLQITSNGSGTGAAAAINGTADLAMLSRDLKSAEKEQGLVQYTIGLDGIMAIVNNNTGVTNLSIAQLADIFSGKITNWKDVGGNDTPIHVITREEGSGTRDGFEEALKKVDSDFTLVNTAISQASTNAVINAVNNTAGTIGYVSIGYTSSVKENTTICSVDGIEATEANVLNGTYVIQRNLVLSTKGEATGAVKDLIDWVLGTEGQKLLASVGFIALP